jgi:hypothetical protein
MKKTTIFILMIIVLLTGTVSAYASDSYVYNRMDTNLWLATESPAPYRYVGSVTEDTIGVESLGYLTEFTYHDSHYYITNGASLIITDENFKAETILTEVVIDGETQKLAELNGIFLTDEGEIYVCEPSKARILHLDADLNVIRVLGKPDGINLSASLTYQPIKVVVDSNGRIYAIANNVFEGIIEMNPDGTFSRYFGTVKVQYTLAQLFWRSIRTSAQRALSELWLPVNYTNLDIDSEDFIYATVPEAQTASAITKLNAKGVNIIRRQYEDETFIGDIDYASYGIGVPIGPSMFSIIETTNYGVYFVFDRVRNRVFAYDEDGYLLFAFGGMGTKQGRLRSVTDMRIVGDKLMFADRGNASIEIFQLTDYGAKILAASELQYNSDYMSAAEYWEEVLNVNPYFQYAYVGVGKALYRIGDYEQAAKYFQQGQDVEYYSMAYSKTRAGFITEIFSVIMIVIGVAAAGIAALYVRKRVKKRAGGGSE